MTILRRGVAALLHGVPTLVVVAGLVAVGVWGHHTGWTLPKFSSLGESPEEQDDWCGDHGVPEAECVECHEELLPRPKARGWCKLHGVPECVLCYPKLAQLSTTAAVTPADLERAKRSLDFAPRPENNPICKSHLRRIQFADEAAADKAGVAVEPVGFAPAVEFVSAPGEVGHDQTKVAHLSSRAPGSVARVFKHLGDRVARGDLLVLIDANEVGKAKAELLQAFGLLQLKTQSLTSLKAAGAPEARVREAEAAVQEADIRLDAGRQSLVNLGLPLAADALKGVTLDQLRATVQFLALPADVTKTLDTAGTSNLLPLFAPMDGTIVSGDVVTGEVVDTARTLFEVVDTRHLWLTFDVKAEDARRVKVGLPVRFKPDGGSDELAGTLAFVSTQADPKTRTVKVRANLADPDGRQRANTFGSGRVILRDEPAVVTVPTEAVHSDNDCLVVFVRDKDYLRPGSPKVFHVRKVRTGAKTDTHTEIPAGLLPGELIVTKGSGLLLTELLRGDLGEGCACHSKK